MQNLWMAEDLILAGSISINFGDRRAGLVISKLLVLGVGSHQSALAKFLLDIPNLAYSMNSGVLEMHQNTFLTTPDAKKYFLKDLDYGDQKMHQNTLLTTPDIKK